MPKEMYMCQLCANHGIFNQPKKGHKQKCAYKCCPCDMCALNTKRRTLDQIERQLRTGSPPSTRTISSEINESTPKIEHLRQTNKISQPTKHSTTNRRFHPYTTTRDSTSSATQSTTSIFTSIKLLVENA